jgi:hypothetical protein
MAHIKVEGYNNLYRDEETGTVVNKDNTSYNMYINSRKNKQEAKKRQREEFEDLKTEIYEIKLLLKELLNESR